MSAGTVTVSSSRQSSHRVAALARAEGILLWRNRLALLNAVILPAALAHLDVYDAECLQGDRKSTRLNSSHSKQSRMPSSA